MATLRLNERRVDTLKPHKSAYDVRDRELTGFGVRILPSGAKRYFIHSQHHGRRVWKIVGRAGAIGVDEARERARVMLASIRNGTSEQAAAPQDTVFETVGDEVFRRYARNWKPSTLKVNRNGTRNYRLPQGQPELLQQPYSAVVRRTPDRRHRRPRRPALVRVAPQYPGVGGPISPHPVCHHAPGRGLRLPAGRNKSVRGHQAISAPGAGALPVDSRNPPTGRGAGAP